MQPLDPALVGPMHVVHGGTTWTNKSGGYSLTLFFGLIRDHIRLGCNKSILLIKGELVLHHKLSDQKQQNYSEG